MLDESNDENTRLESVRSLASKEVESDHAFKVLEKYSLADKNLKVRYATITSLLVAYPQKSASAIKWLIQNDNNMVILNAIRESLKEIREPFKSEFSQALQRRLADFYGVAEEDALPLLECRIMKSIPLSKNISND